MVSRIRTLLLVMLAIAAGLPTLSNAETHRSTGAVFVMTNAASANEMGCRAGYTRSWKNHDPSRAEPSAARPWPRS